MDAIAFMTTSLLKPIFPERIFTGYFHFNIDFYDSGRDWNFPEIAWTFSDSAFFLALLSFPLRLVGKHMY